MADFSLGVMEGIAVASSKGFDLRQPNPLQEPTSLLWNVFFRVFCWLDLKVLLPVAMEAQGPEVGRGDIAMAFPFLMQSFCPIPVLILEPL